MNPLDDTDAVSVLGDVTLTQPVDIDGDGASEIVTMVMHGAADDEIDTYEEAQEFFRYEVPMCRSARRTRTRRGS